MRSSMEGWHSVKNQIRDIINEWDPIHLFPMAPKDEYKDEIEEVCKLLKKEISMEDIERGIENIFIKSFGADIFDMITNRSECKEVAIKLYKILKSHPS